VSKNTPVFDPDQPHATIMHGDTGDADPSTLPRFQQNGHYFRPDKSYHSPDGLPRKRAAPVEEAPVDTLPGIDESEVAELLTDPRADQFLELTRDALVALVTAANGPVVSGEGSTRMMAAWLCKHTTGAIPAADVP